MLRLQSSAFDRRRRCGKVVMVSRASRLDAEAGLAPVSPLGVVSTSTASVYCTLCPASSIAIRGDAIPDGVTGPQSDPLRDGAVLLLRLRELLLRAERLVGLYARSVSKTIMLLRVSFWPYRHLDVCQ